MWDWIIGGALAIALCYGASLIMRPGDNGRREE